MRPDSVRAETSMLTAETENRIRRFLLCVVGFCIAAPITYVAWQYAFPPERPQFQDSYFQSSDWSPLPCWHSIGPVTDPFGKNWLYLDEPKNFAVVVAHRDCRHIPLHDVTPQRAIFNSGTPCEVEVPSATNRLVIVVAPGGERREFVIAPGSVKAWRQQLSDAPTYNLLLRLRELNPDLPPEFDAFVAEQHLESTKRKSENPS